jgi:hypothetical protein
MSKSGGKDKATVPISAVKGNPLFEKAVEAIALDDNTTRWLCVSVLKTLGTTPDKLTLDDLGNLLPEIDRRLRKLLPDAQSDAAMKRLYRVLFEQAEPA